ncbi:hypothetical protein JO972_16425 [Verrucomicrobiaceae bacterium 5K15]|uniref:Uncharacterized protein n=1 Tax=Oceaniferula flava TaxID=2800421 RepID=A0AAE2V963_9BACT|nr:hypothetical protein [Oceaniferula flavus]MBK1856557.1 hypothetical protein [Oceaniferula flavus]MBM1137864.1 hypothetical protein [Oceaniferula flavus]
MNEPEHLCPLIIESIEHVEEALSLIDELRTCTSPIENDKLLEALKKSLLPIEGKLEKTRAEASLLRKWGQHWKRKMKLYLEIDSF